MTLNCFQIQQNYKIKKKFGMNLKSKCNKKFKIIQQKMKMMIHLLELILNFNNKNYYNKNN